jgi:hypothetical protein
MVQRTISSDERREHKRAAGELQNHCLTEPHNRRIKPLLRKRPKTAGK